MPPTSPRVNDVNRLIFGGVESRVADSDHEDLPLLSMPDETEGKGTIRRDSMYVKELEKALITVLEHERHLFEETELQFLQKYNALTYPAKYIITRLCLRSHKWLRRSKLGSCEKELESSFMPTLQSLYKSSPTTTTATVGTVKVEPELETIDLTVDPLEGQDVKPSVSLDLDCRNSLLAEAQSDFSYLIESAESADLSSLLGCLTVDELKVLAKSYKYSNKASNRRELFEYLVGVANQLPQSKGKLKQTTLIGGMNGVRKQMRKLIMQRLGVCVRLNKNIIDLMRRIDIIYLRSTKLSPSMLTPAILANAGRWNYEVVDYKRRGDIWPTREAYLAYERALHIEADIDWILNPSSLDTVFSGRFTSTVKEAHQIKKASSEVSGEQPSDLNTRLTDAKYQAKKVKAIFEQIYPEWVELAKTLGEEGPRLDGLHRFEHGHVLTRIVHKGANAMGILHDYEEEIEVLRALLGQRRWRRDRRGAWYDRWALILMNHCGRSRETKLAALVVAKTGLADPDTHLIYRDRLDRRLHRLEKQLDIEPSDRHICQGNLQGPKNVFIKAKRPPEQLGPLLELDEARRNKISCLDSHMIVLPKHKKLPETPKKLPGPGRTVWIGEEGISVNVEHLALQHYAKRGYKGYHCEAGILYTLFGILFWDILFSNCPGAFETKYQQAPLDLGEETFMLTRADAIQRRLDDLKKGKAVEIFEPIDNAHRDKRTMCIGVNWRFSRDELREILECFNGNALALICEIFCQDYYKRRSGLPDLFLWHPERKICKLVEVKSPNDKLQENQKVWIDVLCGANVAVEVCHVEDEDANETKTSSKKRKRPAPVKMHSSDGELELPFDDEEYRPGPSALIETPIPASSPISGHKRRNRRTRSDATSI